jgi:hypothetical protein
MTRDEILDTAKQLINGERQQHYGSPKDSFARIGDLWTAYLGDAIAVRISAVDAANMLALLKIARLANGPHQDSFIDACGYMALAGEMGSKSA